MTGKAFAAVLAVSMGALTAGAAEPTETLTVRLVHPDRQLERLIGLFDGSRAPHPAAALAAWKHANPRAKGLGKGPEAAIAALNPPMVRELRTLDGARIGLGFDPGDGHVRWLAVIPSDDGSFAAGVTALALTDGGIDPPLAGNEVDRLGPPGSALSARVAGALTFAGSRDDLAAAARLRDAEPSGGLSLESGWRIRLEPDGLPANGSILLRRLVETFRGAACRGAEATIRLEGETLALDLAATFSSVGGANRTIESTWLDGVPASGTLGAWALALDPRPDAWNAFFALADRVERVDPARAKAAPLRTRFSLLGAAAGVRFDLDVWPKLRGASGCVLAAPNGKITGVVLALHAIDEAAAARLAGHVVPRFAGLLGGEKKAVEPIEGVRRLGRAGGRPVSVAQRGTTVVVGWGDTALESWLEAAAHPDRSAAPAMRARWGTGVPGRTAVVWPGLLGQRALAGAPPVVWWGSNDGGTSRDSVRWGELRGVVRRFLESVPLDTPPDR